MHEPLRCPVEATAVAQVAVDWYPTRPMPRPVEADRRQRSQRRTLLRQSLVDAHPTRRVQSSVANAVAPVDVLPLELTQIGETARWPEAALEVAHPRFDSALLARTRRRARARVEAVVAAQVQEAVTPDHLITLAASDDRAQVVVDALARHTAQPLERAHVPLEKRLERQVEREERRLRTRVRQRRNQRVHPPLPPRHGRPGRHLAPIELQHLPRPIARPLRRPHRRRPQLLQASLHQPHRAGVAVVVAENLRQPRRLDTRPLLEQPPQHRLQRIELRPGRRPPIMRRLITPRQPGDRAPVDPQPLCDLALRDPVRRSRRRSTRTSRPTPAPAPTPTSSAPPHPSLDNTDPSSLDNEPDAISDAASGALFDYRSWRSIEMRASQIAWSR
jgi:hypothetical protein